MHVCVHRVSGVRSTPVARPVLLAGSTSARADAQKTEADIQPSRGEPIFYSRTRVRRTVEGVKKAVIIFEIPLVEVARESTFPRPPARRVRR